MENSSLGCVIALDVGGTSVKSGLVGAGAVLTAPVTTPLDQAGPAEAILSVFRGALELHLRELAGRPLLGVGLGFPAPFDYPAGVCLMRHKFAALYGRNIRAELQAALPDARLPVLFRNDAEAAIVGEARYGVGRRYRRLIGLTLGTGLGSAFLDAGEPVKEGPSLPPQGELYAEPALGATADDVFSIRGLTARLRTAAPRAPDIRTAAERARAGDTPLVSAFAQFGADLAAFLLPYVRGFAAEAVLLLGGLANAADLFAPTLAAGLPATVAPGELGQRAALLGAAALIESA